MRFTNPAWVFIRRFRRGAQILFLQSAIIRVICGQNKDPAGEARHPEIWQWHISREDREGGEGKRLFPSVFFAPFA
jgi:hypothetical protein